METWPGVVKYREWELKLVVLREANRGVGSPEEDALLDEADALWWVIISEERAYLNRTISPNHEALIRWLP